MQDGQGGLEIEGEHRRIAAAPGEGAFVVPEAAFLLPAGTLLSHDWLAPQVVRIDAQRPSRIAADRPAP